MTKTAISYDFDLALRAFRRAEDRLGKHLDELAASRQLSREDGGVLAQARGAESACRHCWESLERFRCAYWRARAEAAHAEILRRVPDLVAELWHYARYAGDHSPGLHVLPEQLRELSPPAVDPGGEIPRAPVASPMRARAGNEIF